MRKGQIAAGVRKDDSELAASERIRPACKWHRCIEAWTRDIDFVVNLTSDRAHNRLLSKGIDQMKVRRSRRRLGGTGGTRSKSRQDYTTFLLQSKDATDIQVLSLENIKSQNLNSTLLYVTD